MGKLKLYGTRASGDEIITTALKGQHEPQQIIEEPRDHQKIHAEMEAAFRTLRPR